MLSNMPEQLPHVLVEGIKSFIDSNKTQLKTDSLPEEPLGQGVFGIIKKTGCILFFYPIFLSDDKGSKRLGIVLKEVFGTSIEVLNREEACKRVQEIGSGKLNKRARKALSHD